MKKQLLYLLLLTAPCLHAQNLKPGFDKPEYLDMLKISARFGDSAYANLLPKPAGYRHVYRSPEVGLENCWDLWLDTNRPLAVVSVRGTTPSADSWLANFYAAMVPAKGSLQLSNTEKVDYNLTENPRAAVHIGWLLGTLYLSKTIVPKIDSCYKAGIREVIIFGHSQGGAIAYLLTSHLYSLQRQNLLPADIRFKTYCSAGPKPGNLYYAYDYEAQTQGGWAYNVVSSEDWVPEMPFSIQTLNDFSQTNPFTNAGSTIKKMKFPDRIVLKYVYKKLSKPTAKAQRQFEKYMGKKAGKFVEKKLPGYVQPEYLHTNNYVRTGNTIVLTADAEYLKKFPHSETNVFAHHLHPMYFYLAERLNIGASPADTTK